MVVHRLWPLLFAACYVARTFTNVQSQLYRRQEPSATESAAPASSTKCGEIIDAVNSPENYYIFRASVAYDCLASVPFNPAVATRFLKYWNETIQFQSTLAYLKNPPEGYQQPPVDVAQELADIQQRINEGFYTNQYAFEADFQLLTYAMHDAHVALTAGVLASFSFASPYEIVSVSVDGKQAPKIYLKDDVIESQKNGSTPSAISAINGEDPVEFLTKYAALNSWGFVEPHAEWNALMSSPTLDIQGGLSIFSGGGTFYPGANLTFTFEGGKESIETIWVAIYNDHANHTGPLTTGGDFYNYFVLGLLPDSFNASLIVPPDMGDSNTTEAAGNWYEASSGAFPKSPSIVQPGLDILDHGFVSGYFYNDSSIGVLSLPSFDSIPESMDEYLEAVKEFIVEAHGTGLDRVVIDLQSNSGGATLFAYSIFKLFFPDLMPFGGSRRRIFPMANMLGSAATGVWEGLDETDSHQLEVKQETAASEWIITNRINAEAGRNFTSWEEYQGPLSYNGDFFSLTEQYDLANPIWARSAFDSWPPTMYMPDKSKWPIIERAWNPDQIVLLTDGLCSSTCALLVEMMTHAGVRTVVAGGRPSSGPMQTASGNRGASVYSSYEVDDDMDSLRMQDYLAEEDVNATIPEVRETGMHIKHSTFNLRDQIRQNDSVPLQFKYEAADCRIYYTLANMYNMTRLWHDAAAAIFDDQSLCVEGSTGFSATNNTGPKPPPKPETSRPTISQDNPTVEHVEFEDDPTGGLRNGRGEPRGGNIIELCNNDGSCNNPQSQCRSININCPNSAVLPIRACLPYCTNREGSTACPGTCEMSKTQESKGKVHGHTGAGYTGNPLLGGLCYPKTGNKKLGCPTNP